MRSATIVRQPSTDEGTFGVLTLDSGDRFHTGELPWRNNSRGISCIPPGEYRCAIYQSPKFGRVYAVRDVPKRSNILIHRGNWCGDKLRGYKSDVLGCILLGMRSGWLSGRRAVLDSGAAIEKFMTLMGGEDFLLRIE